MELTLSKAICGEQLSNESTVVESIRRLKDYCWDIADRIRKGTGGVEDAIRGIAFARDMALILTYYEVSEFTSLTPSDIFLAEETANAALHLSVQYVRTHID